MRISSGIFGLTFIAIGLLSGCVSGPNLGDSISTRSETLSQTEKSYLRGQKLVANGQKNISNGRKQVTKGEDQIRNSQWLIDQASREFCDEIQYNDPACK